MLSAEKHGGRVRFAQENHLDPSLKAFEVVPPGQIRPEVDVAFNDSSCPKESRNWHKHAFLDFTWSVNTLSDLQKFLILTVNTVVEFGQDSYTVRAVP